LYSWTGKQFQLEHLQDREGISVSEWKGEMIVHAESKIKIKLRIGVFPQQAINAVEGLQSLYEPIFDDLGWGFFLLPENESLFKVIEQLEKNPLFEIVEPVYVGELGLSPNDNRYWRQWHLNNTGQSPTNGTAGADISAEQVWDITTGSNDVVIAILDTGIPMQNGELSHEDLSQTGRFILGSNFADPTDPEGVRDKNGHGTHVAGIAAAHTNNSIGIAGVNWVSDIMVIITNRHSDGRYFENWFYQAVKEASDFSESNNRPVVINFSSGGGQPSQLYVDAIEYARDRDVLIVSITHNDGENDFVRYPARYSESYDNVIAVAATDHNDVRASFSNAGSQVNISVPGGYVGGAGDSRNIYSTMANYAVTMTQQHGYSQYYDYMPGTSVAAPQVAATAALILSVNPNLTPSQIRTTLHLSADKVPGMDGEDFTNEYGYGRLNANKAVRNMYVPQVYPNIAAAVSVAVSGQTIYVSSGNYTLTSNVIIPSGVTLTLLSGANVNFNGRYIDATNGVFNIQNGSTVYVTNGNKIFLKRQPYHAWLPFLSSHLILKYSVQKQNRNYFASLND
jgi:subtilisin family serine protease